MDHASMVVLAKAIIMATSGLGPVIGIGLLFAKALEAIGRNPEATGKIFVPMLLGAAFAESIAIYALVIVFTLK
jgi:F-type H+-transporting ATPase subunit c